MVIGQTVKKWLRFTYGIPMLFLNGCAHSGLLLLEPRGLLSDTAVHYFTLDVGIMLLIIVPTALLAIWAMWRYRRGGRGAYRPDWSHSGRIELVVWGIPLVTVAVLSYLSIKAIYELNPYNPTILARTHKAAGRPLRVDVIATDWRWLFIYPRQHIASVNELVVPVHRPIRFRLTSTSVVNDFLIPQLVGMIDVMPGMRVKEAMVVNKPGHYLGFSADYSGAGLSWMHFDTHAVSVAQFRRFVAAARSSGRGLTDTGFNRFARPFIAVGGARQVFGRVQQGLFGHVVREVMRGKVWRTPMDMTENMVRYMKQQRAEQNAGEY